MLWLVFCIFVVLLDVIHKIETGAVLGFDRVAKVMLACSALYGEHLKENVHILVGENTYALAA